MNGENEGLNGQGSLTSKEMAWLSDVSFELRTAHECALQGFALFSVGFSGRGFAELAVKHLSNAADLLGYDLVKRA